MSSNEYMFETLRCDFELNHIKGDYLIVFRFMEELRTIAHTYPQKNLALSNLQMESWRSRKDAVVI